MKYLKFLLKFVFFPVRILNNIIYGGSPINVAYSWYSPDNYRKMVEHAKDDKDSLIRTYEDWKENADQRIEKMKSMNMKVFRVNINYDEMSNWLSRKGLDNTVENREAFIDHKFQNFMEDPMVN